MDFPTKLRNLRIQRGLTQMELAEKLGTSQSSITSWEQNRREPDFLTIKRIADFFHVPMSALLPSADDLDESVNIIAECLHRNQKLKALFECVKDFGDADLDALLAVAKAVSGKRE